jgi:glycosyltransferase involved in cell wall biosynthesis
MSGAVTVSVITPCYNGARYLEETLRSAIQQTRPPTEIIVIDDGSTDDSAAIAERLGPPVRVIRQTNHGESVARNRGLAEARGSHVLFLDADDVLAPDALRHLAGALDSRAGAVAIMGSAFFTSDPDAIQPTPTPEHDKFYPGIIQSNFGPPHCWLAPLGVIRGAGGFCETLQWFEDWDLWWRVGLQEPQLISVPYIGARYRQHATSQLATVSAANRTRGHVALIDRMADAFLESPRLMEKYGDDLFWCMWTALARAHAAGVKWSELRSLSSHLRAVSRRTGGRAGRSTTGRLVRTLGARAAFTLRPHATESA